MSDLNGLQDYLFNQLKRLDGELSGDALKTEIDRANAVATVAKVAVENANTAIKAMYVADGFVKRDSKLPKMLES